MVATEEEERLRVPGGGGREGGRVAWSVKRKRGDGNE